MMALGVSVALFAIALSGLAWCLWRTNRGVIAFTPLAMFALFEITWAWPSTIYAQYTGLASAKPALLMGFAFLAFLASYVAILRWLRVDHRVVRDFVGASAGRAHVPAVYAVTIALAAMCLIALGVYLYQGLPLIAEHFLQVLSFDGTQRADAYDAIRRALVEGREEVTKGYYFGGAYRGQGAILQIQQVGWPFITFTAFMLYTATRARAWLAAAAVLFLLSLVFVGGAGERLQIIMVFVFFTVCLSLLKPLRLRTVATFCVGMLVAAILIAPLSGQFNQPVPPGAVDYPTPPSTLDAAAEVAGRILLGNGLTNLEVMNFIAVGDLEHRWGRIHYEKFLTGLPGVTVGVPFAVEIQKLRRPGENTTAFASMTYFGILYADFAAGGVVAAYAGMGALTAFAHARVFTARKDVLSLPALAFVVVYFGDLSLGSSVSVFFSLLVVLIFYLCMRVCAEALSRHGPKRLRTAPHERPHKGGLARGNPHPIGDASHKGGHADE